MLPRIGVAQEQGATHGHQVPRRRARRAGRRVVAHGPRATRRHGALGYGAPELGASLIAIFSKANGGAGTRTLSVASVPCIALHVPAPCRLGVRCEPSPSRARVRGFLHRRRRARVCICNSYGLRRPCAARVPCRTAWPAQLVVSLHLLFAVRRADCDPARVHFVRAHAYPRLRAENTYKK